MTTVQRDHIFGISMATLNTFVLLTATRTPTAKRECIVASPCKQWLLERAKM